MRFCPTDGAALYSASADPLIGQTIADRFRVDAQVGEGGSGRVYRGVQLGVARAIAIKIMPRADAGDRAASKRFEAEARILSRMRHPNTLRLIDFGHLPDGRAWLATPFLQGQTLRDRLRDGPLSVAETLDVLRQVASALEESHGAGVVHRDLKPANLFLETIAGRTVVRVIDFGIAQQAEDVRLTAEGQTVGTSTYMSPEQIRGERVDARSDLYSLGVVAFECLAGRAPFEGPNRVSVIMQHLNDAPAALNIDAEVASLVRWCLEKRAVDRPPDASAVLEAIADMGQGDLPAPSAGNHRQWLIAGLVLGIAVMGALIGWTWDPEHAPRVGAAASDSSIASTAPATAALPTPISAAAKANLPRQTPRTAAPATASSTTPMSAVPEAAVRAPTSGRRSRRGRARAPRSVAPSAPATTAPLTAPQPPEGLF